MVNRFSSLSELSESFKDPFDSTNFALEVCASRQLPTNASLEAQVFEPKFYRKLYELGGYGDLPALRESWIAERLKHTTERAAFLAALAEDSVRAQMSVFLDSAPLDMDIEKFLARVPFLPPFIEEVLPVGLIYASCNEPDQGNIQDSQRGEQATQYMDRLDRFLAP